MSSKSIYTPQKIYLYVKTHNITGLKYMGKTVQDPYEYKGSGMYWVSHLRKYGNDVTTEIIHESYSKEKTKEAGLYYSKLYNIVESDEWANLVEETGSGGWTPGCFKKGHIPWIKGKKCPHLSENKKRYWEKWRESNPNYKDKWKINNKVRKGFDSQERERRRHHANNLNKQIIVCPHCDKTGNLGNMKRWHFDNCKYKT